MRSMLRLCACIRPHRNCCAVSTTLWLPERNTSEKCSPNRPNSPPSPSSDLSCRILSLAVRFGEFEHDPVRSEKWLRDSTRVYQIFCIFKHLNVTKWN